MAYVLLGAGRLDLPASTLGAQTGHVTGEVQDGTFGGGEHGGCVGGGTGHVQGADLVAAASEVAQGDELGGAGGGHGCGGG